LLTSSFILYYLSVSNLIRPPARYAKPPLIFFSLYRRRESEIFLRPLFHKRLEAFIESPPYSQERESAFSARTVSLLFLRALRSTLCSAGIASFPILLCPLWYGFLFFCNSPPMRVDDLFFFGTFRVHLFPSPAPTFLFLPLAFKKALSIERPFRRRHGGLYTPSDWRGGTRSCRQAPIQAYPLFAQYRTPRRFFSTHHNGTRVFFF